MSGITTNKPNIICFPKESLNSVGNSFRRMGFVDRIINPEITGTIANESDISPIWKFSKPIPVGHQQSDNGGRIVSICEAQIKDIRFRDHAELSFSLFVPSDRGGKLLKDQFPDKSVELVKGSMLHADIAILEDRLPQILTDTESYVNAVLSIAGNMARVLASLKGVELLIYANDAIEARKFIKEVGEPNMFDEYFKQIRQHLREHYLNGLAYLGRNAELNAVMQHAADMK